LEEAVVGLAGRLLYGDSIGFGFSRHPRSWCHLISPRIFPVSYFRANADAIVLTNRKIGALRLPQSGFVQGRFGPMTTDVPKRYATSGE
jgi:hypothetical protein